MITFENNLNPDQAQHFIGPEVGSNCFQNFLEGKEISINPDGEEPQDCSCIHLSVCSVILICANRQQLVWLDLN